jgi:hypothetical protein
MRTPSPPPNRFQNEMEPGSSSVLASPAPIAEQPVVPMAAAPSIEALRRLRRVRG